MKIKIHRTRFTILLTAFLILFATVALGRAAEPAAPQTPTLGTTTRVSVASDGTEGNAVSTNPSVSVDRRYIAFSSDASNLVNGDTNGERDVFLHDTQTGQTTRVSVASDGTQGNEYSGASSLSSDGRYVAFSSSASNLVSGDTNGYKDVFVHDTQTGQTTRVSVASEGAQGNNNSHSSSLSADGRYVAFVSDADNLVSGDTNGTDDIFVHDTLTGQTTRVSVASDGMEADDRSDDPAISADGQYVAFSSHADNLVGEDTIISGIFLHDRQTGQTTCVSVASDGTIADGGSDFPAISADGHYVAFESTANNLVDGGPEWGTDIFMHDTLTGQTTRVSVSSSGAWSYFYSFFAPSISSDGRYVAFESNAQFFSGDTNDAEDIFVHDTQTGQTTSVSVASDGTQGNEYSRVSSISPDGRYVAFGSDATNLISGDTNGWWDVFLHDRGPELVPTLTLNHLTGAPGSYFTLTGSGFNTNNTIVLTLNGATLGTTPTDGDGAFEVILSTGNADEGYYHLTVSGYPSAGASFTLDA
ncbi:MAG: hypothetical protein GY792_37175, partial [Gammaproteobacteria bacterium]|nr:hypothetical protein [Gammaproteobacteria bacterium]